MELSEAAPLADMFVFRLMFRLYSLPSAFKDYLGRSGDRELASAQFYQSKRLLSAFAAREYPAKVRREGGTIDQTRYLVISAISVDLGTGACSAVSDGRCGIYDRRPLACRTAPLHYSRPEVFAESDLAAFVATEGYACDTSDSAKVVVEGRQIVDPAIRKERANALLIAERDRRWSEAIARRMKDGGGELPTPQQVEANAALGATTVPMRAAWRIAAKIGLMSASDCDALVAQQAALIDRELAAASSSRESRALLAEMRAEYHAG